LSCTARQAGRRQRDAHLLQVVAQALRGVGHLRGLVAGAVQADDQAKTGQLVGAHTLDGGDFLDACGEDRRGQHAKEQQQAVQRRIQEQRDTGVGKYIMEAFRTAARP
jgi:hypothetical protein